MSQSQTSDNIKTKLEQRRLEMLREEQTENITIGEARRSITPLESIFPRVSLKETQQEGEDITAVVLNVRSLSNSMFESITSDVTMLKARIFTKIKYPTKDIQNINITSSKDITLPLIGVPTGRKFHTVKVNLE